VEGGIVGICGESHHPIILLLESPVVFGILFGSPLAVAKAAATLPGVHMKHNTEHQWTRTALGQNYI
jgi:hypothetical protein